MNLSSNYSCIQSSVNDTTLHYTQPCPTISSIMSVSSTPTTNAYTCTPYFSKERAYLRYLLIFTYITLHSSLHSTLSQFVSLPSYNYSKSLINFSLLRLLIILTLFYHSTQHPPYKTSNIKIEI